MPVGVLTSTDLLRTQTRSVVYVASDIHKRDSAEGISKALAPLPSVVLDLVEAGAGAYAIGHAVTAVADSATQRLIQLAEAELGPPPVPYAWMALGSQGRNEQTARSDQDNALLIADDFDPDRARPLVPGHGGAGVRRAEHRGVRLVPRRDHGQDRPLAADPVRVESAPSPAGSTGQTPRR